MRSTSGNREFGFVLAVALAGLALVLAVVFAPWYPASSAASAPPGSSAPAGTPVG